MELAVRQLPFRAKKHLKLCFFYLYKYRCYPYLATFKVYFKVINEKEAS